MPERSGTERNLAGESPDSSGRGGAGGAGKRRALRVAQGSVRRSAGGEGRNRPLVDLRQTATRSGEILVAKGGIATLSICARPLRGPAKSWWPRAESNHRHKDFQSSALPTELLGLSGEL